MDGMLATAPFGRRTMSYTQFQTQRKVRQAIVDAGQAGGNAPVVVNKWHLFRTLTEIRERLGVSDRSLSVLNALLSFHQETALTLSVAHADNGDEDKCDQGNCDLIVFPSNRALAQRAHGMTASTLWRHLTALIGAGLILRRDSPNGKRYARRDASGEERYSDAFGFDLTPLVARAAEFDNLLEEARTERRQRALLKERISLLRRDVSKLLAMDDLPETPAHWPALEREAASLMQPLRSVKSMDDLRALESALETLRRSAVNALEVMTNVQNMQCNECQNAAHQSISKHQMSSDIEPTFGSTKANLSDHARDQIPLTLVLEACPDILDYAENQEVRNWPAFERTVETIRPMIGISPDAWAEAVAVLGRRDAQLAVASILQRSEHSSEAERRDDGSLSVNASPAIRSPGGYLRALTEQARLGQFAIGPILMALIGQRLKTRRGGVSPTPSNVRSQHAH